MNADPNQALWILQFAKMKCIFTFYTFLVAIIAHAEQSRTLELQDVVKTSLIFETTQGSPKHYPNTIRVILRMENIHDSDVSWVSETGGGGFSAELVDEKGKLVPQPPSAASILSNPCSYVLPYGSRLDWLISSEGGISMIGDLKTNYALIIGGNGWLIPIEKLESYSLKISFRGRLWSRNTEVKCSAYNILLNMSLTRIKILGACPEALPEKVGAALRRDSVRRASRVIAA